MYKTYLVSFYWDNGDDGCLVRTISMEHAIELAKEAYPKCFNFFAVEYA